MNADERRSAFIRVHPRPLLLLTFYSERQLRAELNRARIADRADRAKRAAKVLHRKTRDTSEVRLVENVENLTAKLQLPRLTKTEVLERREVYALRRRSLDRATTRITHDIRDSGSGGRIDLETHRARRVTNP